MSRNRIKLLAVLFRSIKFVLNEFILSRLGFVLCILDLGFRSIFIILTYSVVNLSIARIETCCSLVWTIKLRLITCCILVQIIMFRLITPMFLLFLSISLIVMCCTASSISPIQRIKLNPPGHKPGNLSIVILVIENMKQFLMQVAYQIIHLIYPLIIFCPTLSILTSIHGTCVRNRYVLVLILMAFLTEM